MPSLLSQKAVLASLSISQMVRPQARQEGDRGNSCSQSCGTSRRPSIHGRVIA